LSNKLDVATNASKIFELLIQYLCVEHIDYAIELGLQGQYHVGGEIYRQELSIVFLNANSNIIQWYMLHDAFKIVVFYNILHIFAEENVLQ